MHALLPAHPLPAAQLVKAGRRLRLSHFERMIGPGFRGSHPMTDIRRGMELTCIRGSNGQAFKRRYKATFRPSQPIGLTSIPVKCCKLSALGPTAAGPHSGVSAAASSAQVWRRGFLLSSVADLVESKQIGRHVISLTDKKSVLRHPTRAGRTLPRRLVHRAPPLAA